MTEAAPKPSILVVDDHEESIVAVTALLRSSSAEVLAARSGQQALELLLEHPVAIALIDVQMPDMDGLELAEIMRSSPRTKDIPIIFITGHQETGREFKGYERGAVDYLLKPLDPLVLRSKVSVFLDLHTSKRQLAARVAQLEAALEAERRARAAAQEAEAARRESEERFRTLAENTSPLTWMANETGDIFWYSKRWFEFTGATLDEMKRWGWQKFHHPEHVERVLSKIRHCFETGESWEDTFPVRGRDGGYRWFLSRAIPIRNATGGVVRWFGTATDVTELLEAQAALRRERDFTSALVDTAGALVVVLDREGRITRFNHACERVTGFLAEEVQGRHYEIMVPEEQRPAVGALWAATLNGTYPNTYENEWLTRTGERRLITWSNTALVDANGSVEHVIASGLDITERHAAELALREVNERLIEADHRKNEFIAVLSHELRNPLAPIRTSVYILEHATPGGEQAKRARQVIDRQAQHLTRLIDDLLDITRITRGTVVLQRERVDLNDLVKGTAEDYRAQFLEAGIDLVVHLAAVPVLVDGDPVRLAQVFGNLLSNAAKFTPRGGQTVVSVEAEGRHATVKVRDNGAGIALEILEHLFEPFVQGAQTLARSRGGLGLGLALAKRLVEMHGGEVTAHSEGAGTGAEFVVRLPLESRVRPAPCATGGGAVQVILVIEDNVDAAESLKEALELGGHQVSVAHTGREGLAMARQVKPQVVLCDIGLPDLDGYGVASAIRSDPDPAVSGMLMVALSGYALPEDVHRSEAAGFDRHIAKPPSMADIEKAMMERPTKAGPNARGPIR